jgi:hypothetical protein
MCIFFKHFYPYHISGIIVTPSCKFVQTLRISIFWFIIRKMNWDGLIINRLQPSRGTTPTVAEETEKNHTKHCQDSRCPGPDSKETPRECKSRELRYTNQLCAKYYWWEEIKNYNDFFTSSVIMFKICRPGQIRTSIYGSTPLCWTLTAFSVSSSFYAVGRIPWTGYQPVARPLPAHKTA